MKHYFKKIFPIILAMSVLPFPAAGEIAYEREPVFVRVNPDFPSPFGPFQGFGTSLCWWANYLGYSENLTEKAAKLFFSNKDGLGLNVVRYNIGGGDNPKHTHMKHQRPDADMPGVLNPDGTYDFSKDKNQINVLLAAVREGVKYLEAFSNSPPYFMTVSGCTSGHRNPNMDNIDPEKYGEFCDFLTEVLKYFKDTYGIEFDSVDPFNEPDTNYWSYGGRQEGCHVSPGEPQSQIVLTLAKSLKEKGLNTIISAADETNVDTQLKNIYAFSKEALDAIGRINTHTYHGTKKAQLREVVSMNKKDLWMSESDAAYTAGDKAGIMGAALGLAEKISTDMNELMPSAWVIWQIIDQHFDDTFYTRRNFHPEWGYWGCAIADHSKEDIILTKKYYAFGQFSKFIRPGYIQVETSDKYTVAAYDPETGAVVLVVTNLNSQDLDYTFDLSGFSYLGTNVSAYRTSLEENWAKLPSFEIDSNQLKVNIKGNSITSFVIMPNISGREVIIGNEKGASLGAFTIEKADGAYKIFGENKKALKSDLTFGDFTNDDLWEISPKEDGTYEIVNAKTKKALTSIENSFSYEGNLTRFRITLNEKPLKIELSAPNKLISVGEKIKITSNVPDLIFTVSDDTKAKIDEAGNFEALSGGVVTVKATSKNDPYNYKTLDLTIIGDGYVRFYNRACFGLLDDHSIFEIDKVTNSPTSYWKIIKTPDGYDLVDKNGDVLYVEYIEEDDVYKLKKKKYEKPLSVFDLKVNTDGFVSIVDKASNKAITMSSFGAKRPVYVIKMLDYHDEINQNFRISNFN